jgi:hypothetical protein
MGDSVRESQELRRSSTTPYSNSPETTAPAERTRTNSVPESSTLIDRPFTFRPEELTQIALMLKELAQNPPAARDLTQTSPRRETLINPAQEDEGNPTQARARVTSRDQLLNIFVTAITSFVRSFYPIMILVIVLSFFINLTIEGGAAPILSSRSVFSY